MEIDDCVIVATFNCEDPSINTAEASGMLSQARASPTTPASAKKLVQARLPFKPLHTAQCGSDGVTPKKRKLVDTNANFQPAKNLKKADEEGQMLYIDSNSDECKPVLEVDGHSPVPVIRVVQDATEADNNLVCLNDAAALAERTEKQEPVEASKENCLRANQYEDVSSAHMKDCSVNDTSEFSCTINENNITNRDVDTDTTVDKSAACSGIFDSAEQSSCDSGESGAMEFDVSKETVQLTDLVQCRESNNSDLSNNTSENVEVNSSAKLNDCDTDLANPADESADDQTQAMTKSALEGGSTPVNKKRKSLDKKANSLKKEQKEERERLKAVEKERKEKEKEEAKLKKLQERQEKEKEREKEKAEKEKEKAEKRKQKEDEKLRKQEQLLEEKKKREEAKLEEKKKKEEKKEKQDEKKLKEKELMQKFFVKSAKDPAVQKIQNDTKCGPFMEFQVKENMRLAPILRLEPDAIQQAASNLDSFLFGQVNDVDIGQLYIQMLKNVNYRPKTYPSTWPSRSIRSTEDVIMLPCSDQTAGCFMRAKLFQFHDNYRPAYYGTWRKRSGEIKPRNPWRLDKQLLDYEVDSDEEWEEEEPGESLSHSEPDDDDEDDADPDEDNDGFFVPHGYLSEGEGCEDDDDDVRDSPGKLKACQLAKARNWEAELRFKKSEAIQTVVIGVCWWTPDLSALDPLYSKLREFQIQLYEPAPISTSLPTVEVQPRRSKQNKCDNKANGKSVIWVPVPDAALADLVRLVHGNEWSIKKLIREFCEFWRCKNCAPVDGEKQRLLSKRQLEAKIRQIAVYESRPEYPRRKLWYINADTLDRLQLVSLPVPTQWQWLTKAAKS